MSHTTKENIVKMADLLFFTFFIEQFPYCFIALHSITNVKVRHMQSLKTNRDVLVHIQTTVFAYFVYSHFVFGECDDLVKCHRTTQPIDSNDFIPFAFCCCMICILCLNSIVPSFFSQVNTIFREF